MLAGLGAGLAISPAWAPPGGTIEVAAALVLSLILLVDRGRIGPAGVILLCAGSVLFGTCVGGERIAAIDSGALRDEPGTRVELTGVVEGAIKNSRGITRIPVETARGKVMVEAASVPAGLRTGDGVMVTGKVRTAPDWYRPTLERLGIARIVAADRVVATGGGRGGLTGLVDRLRNRASTALGRAMPEREASLARGFVLGQDEGIDERTEEHFQDSGLSHLLAVSGQNIVLLGLLALPFMAIAGLGPRARIAVVAALIAVYVPLTGAGASIQRAGIMGLAGLAALVASRPASRLFALAIAAVLTLALNPRATGDVGWQLSFAAVTGIYLLAGPISRRLEPLAGLGPGDGGSGDWRSALIEGLAVSVAASIATGPLIALHFERFPVTTLAANLAALPAVAPAMWFGMISAALGQLSTSLAVPVNLVNSLLLAYIARVAEWFGSPSWAVVEPKLGGPVAVIGIYVLIGVVLAALLSWLTPRRLGRDRPAAVARRWRRILAAASLMAAGLIIALAPSIFGPDRRELAAPPPGGARIEVLDIGQGDAILIRPDGGDPALIDGGPPGGDIRGALDSAGVERLAAVILTHGDLDHAGGLAEVFGAVPVGRFLFDGVPGPLLRQAREAGAEASRIAEGNAMTMGTARMRVLWPPPRTGPGPAATDDPNARSVVIELTVDGFRMLLTGDAESEAAPYATGPVDVLKVAHHGSDDAGLPALLAASDPELAIVSAGEDNQFGHPTPETLADLGEAGIPVARTDRDGTVSVVVDPTGYRIETGH